MPGPKSDKEWSDALRRAMKRESAGKGSPKWLEVIANRVCEAAADGDMQAVREIGDRLDGKPRQQSDITSNGETIAFPSVITLQAEPVSGDD